MLFDSNLLRKTLKAGVQRIASPMGEGSQIKIFSWSILKQSQQSKQAGG